MISTRLHGLIDYTVASALGALALSSTLTPRVKAVLGSASAYHTSYAVLTDYEAGLTPRISMPRHLALDALGGIALCGAGLQMKQAPMAQRALLVAFGLAELAVVARSDWRPRAAAHAHGMAYPPLDTPKQVADGVWIVDSVLGPGVPVRMTVVRLSSGDLLLHSPTRFSTALLGELSQLGRVKHLVAPNVVHWTFTKAWQDAVPGTITWGAPGLRRRGQVRRSGLRLDHDLTDNAPAAWPEIDHVLLRGGLGFNEVAMFHRPTRTLLLTDFAMNFEPDKLPPLLRPIARLLGVTAPRRQPPAYLRAIIGLNRGEVAQQAARLVQFHPERIVLTHGRPLEHNAAAALRRSLEWLLD